MKQDNKRTLFDRAWGAMVGVTRSAKKPVRIAQQMKRPNKVELPAYPGVIARTGDGQLVLRRDVPVRRVRRVVA